MDTFLFTDIEGSTRMWEQDAGAMSAVLAQHDAVLRAAIHAHNGRVFKTIGDAFCAVFDSASNALNAAAAIQRGLHDANVPVRVRMALHTGPAEERDGDYFGPTLNRIARILSAGHGQQILLSGAARDSLANVTGIELRDLGTHRLRDVSEPVRIFHAALPDVPNNFTPLKSLTPRPTNLPAALTSFIGREREVIDIGARLRRPETRLLTLIGPGGIGKTRLALQSAGNLRDEFEHGVFFATLGPIRQPDLLPHTIAHALSLEAGECQNPVEALRDYLHERHLLLVLDNFEQILDAAPLVNELLAAAPRLKVLVTSREALDIYGEQTYKLEPLTAPDERQSPTPDAIRQFPAVALFTDRARLALPDFALTEANAGNVAEICRRLDGLPLALELAAARLRHLTLDNIAAQLASRLSLLTAGPRDLPRRQQTMRGAIDWSYHLLMPDEQQWFAQLAVFAGQFTGDAARSVTGRADLERLVSASLVRRVDEHFEMLETLREYALEALQNSSQLPATQQRHAHYYRDYLESVVPHLTGPDQARWFDDMEAAHHNLRAALEWALAQGEHETAARITIVACRLWIVHSHLSEGHQWLGQVLRGQAQTPESLRAKLLHGAGRLEFFRSNFVQSETLLNKALVLYESEGDLRGQANCLMDMGEIKIFQGDAAAEKYLTQSLALHIELGDPHTSGRLLDNLGSVARMMGNYESAEQFYRQGLEVERAGGSLEGQARVLNNLAEMLRVQGKHDETIALYNESLALYKRLNFAFGACTLLLNLAAAERDLNHLERAADLYREALNLLRELDELDLIVTGLAGLAGVMLRLGDAPHAGRLCGMASALMSAHELALEPADQDEFARTMNTVRAQLGEPAWAAAQAESRALSLEQVIIYAMGTVTV
jgi:predicted ATPase